MDALILCGGKGTRLATIVNEIPKPLALVAGRPFLDYLLDYLSKFEQITRVILATGYLANQFESYYGCISRGIPILYSVEDIPVGTGGAIVMAMRRYRIQEPFFIFNGDSFIDADLDRLTMILEDKAALLGLSLFKIADASRFGTVLCSSGKAISFTEKSGLSTPGLINAGVYIASPAAFDTWRNLDKFLSLEQEILPVLVRGGSVSVIETGSRFIDIGTPETYLAATNFFSNS